MLNRKTEKFIQSEPRASARAEFHASWTAPKLVLLGAPAIGPACPMG